MNVFRNIAGEQPIEAIGSASDERRSNGAPAPPLPLRVSVPGRNCWSVERAERAAFLVDGEAYFSALAQSLAQARRRVWILGWDFDPRIRLRPRERPNESLGELLCRLAGEREELEVRVLVWAMGPLYARRSLDPLGANEWARHPRIRLSFDARHPLRGAHHQKAVAIDDDIAFVGGIDLTAGRWDDALHAADSPLRVKPGGEPYGPVHDVQALLAGPAARRIAELAAARWQRSTGERVAPLPAPLPAWPADIAPDIADCDVAIARTLPRLLGRTGRREAVRLTLDALAAARRHVYIETQYLASFRVGRAIARLLQRPAGPEVVIVVTESSHGLLEQFFMAGNRDRLIRRLRRHDPHDRLRVLSAAVPGAPQGEVEVLIHSKLLIVDDAFVRIGSSNLNNRSEGLDTECDVAFEAATPAHRAAIRGLRDRLLGEHMDAEPERVAAAVGRTGSLRAAIERLNVARRGFRPCRIGSDSGGTSPLPGTDLFDPREPYWPLQRLAQGMNWLTGRLRRRPS